MGTDFKPDKPSPLLMYFDVNNLYGTAMSAGALSQSEFQWVNDIYSLSNISAIPDDSEFGYFLEVDVSSSEK